MGSNAKATMYFIANAALLWCGLQVIDNPAGFLQMADRGFEAFALTDVLVAWVG